MYGLRQAAVLAYETVETLLNNAGYHKIRGSLNMWKHATRKITFCLCVDDFGIKFFDRQDVEHLQQTLQQVYTAKIDWSGQNFLGYTLAWNYSQGYVDLSLPGYIIKLLKKLNYSPFIHPQYSPHIFYEKDWIKKGECQIVKRMKLNNYYLRNK